MTNYISRSSQVCFKKGILVFWLTLFPDRSPPSDLYYFLWKLCKLKSFYTIKSHIWSLKIFIFTDFYTYGQFLLKIEKNENLQNWPNMTKYNILRSKMSSSDIISTKNSKSPEKFMEVRTKIKVRHSFKLWWSTNLLPNKYKVTSIRVLCINHV